MEKHQAAFEEFLEHRKLRWLVEFAKDTRAVENPYHNPEHCYWVAGQAFAIMRGLIGRGKIDPVCDSTTAVVIAGLMHDYDHMGGHHLTDHQNIERAVKGMEQVSKIIVKRHGPGTYGMAVQLIRSTEYPAVKNVDWVGEKAIRDADALYSFSENGVDSIMNGLRQEMSIKFQRDVSYQEMFDAQMIFYANTHYHTNYAAFIASQRKDEVIDKMRAYLPTV